MYKGVREIENGKYEASFSDKRIGIYDSKEEAAYVRDLTAVATFGEDCTTDLNFPDLALDTEPR